MTATSATGNVYLYEGSLRDRGQLPPEWTAPAATLQRPGTHPKALPAREERAYPRIPFWYGTPQPLRRR